jgi:hypothetical protein
MSSHTNLSVGVQPEPLLASQDLPIYRKLIDFIINKAQNLLRQITTDVAEYPFPLHKKFKNGVTVDVSEYVLQLSAYAITHHVFIHYMSRISKTMLETVSHEEKQGHLKGVFTAAKGYVRSKVLRRCVQVSHITCGRWLYS